MNKNEERVGTFLGVPYDWRWPTPAVVKERMWNPKDRRVFTPHVFGWGWSINFYELGRRLRLTRTSPESTGRGRAADVEVENESQPHGSESHQSERG